ncbi:hypothetical protein DXG03_006967 [Asterophora parasitica]|uniref:NUC153 domain-containing protein n=1 Tax=Asterophora parasitica TaxID=117018 RepID=A0A9P7GDB4_9AGAR|nr:hypothetical protein DXG03_006967 [Asterophora parasitica]
MSDERFVRLKSDPRFRRPRKKDTKLVIDDRFRSVFAAEKSKTKSARVDKYGRSIAGTQEKDNLKRFYRLETDEGEDQVDPKPFLDYARGEALLESSSDDDEESDAAPDQEDEHIGRDSERPIPIHDDPLAEIDLDETEFADLDAQAAVYNKENPEEDESEGARTHRLAVVNLDWDHVRAFHLFKICSSLVSPTAPAVVSSFRTPVSDGNRHGGKGNSTVSRGRVLNVQVYPSEFGKERMAREETEGPPPEIFKKKNDDDEVNEQNIYDVGDEDDYDKDALRKYQLERLRYYYAIITCDTIDAATHIYRELEGTELERSANVFDLSYVPDDMTFDDKPRDEATDDYNPTYKGFDFVTDALRHSKVKLTWDEDDPERNQITRRTLSKKEIDNADFRAYLASSSESESETNQPSKSKAKDKNASRDKLRALLLSGGGDDLPEGWGCEDDDQGDVDMEITFTPGLSDKKDEGETTLDKYQRKMREKRKKRKDEVAQKVNAGEDDDFFDLGADQKAEGVGEKGRKKPQRKAKEASPEPAARPLTTPEELALLVTSDDPGAHPNHFNLKSVLKAEKKAHRKGKKRKGDKDEEDNEVQADFAINVNDDRFKALHEEHQYAIDPTNPQFKKTSSMNAFLRERARRRKQQSGEGSAHSSTSIQKASDEKSLKSLVESVKRKSVNALAQGTGKRRKV